MNKQDYHALGLDKEFLEIEDIENMYFGFYKQGRLHGILFSSLFWITAIIVFSYVTTTYAVSMTAGVPDNPCNRCLQYCQ